MRCLPGGYLHRMPRRSVRRRSYPRWKPGPPPAANLTPHPEDGLGNWTEADFFRALRQQQRPDGTALSPVMPAAVSQLADTELQAVWKFLQTLRAQPDGA